MEGAPSTLYEGENYRLLFKFNSKYPFDSPQVHCCQLPRVYSSVVITHAAGGIHKTQCAYPSTYIFQWSHLSLYTGQRVDTSSKYISSVCQHTEHAQFMHY